MARTQIFTLKFSIALVMAVALMLAVPIQGVYAAKGDLKSINSKKGPVNLTLGKADMIKVGGDVSDVLVADPSVIDVMAVKSSSLYVVGSSVGDTNIIVLDAVGDVLQRIDVHVSYDLLAIQTLVDDLFPDENVKVGSIHDQILLTGTVSNPAVASKVVNIVGHYVGDLQDENKTADELISNLLDVRGEQQVMLQVKILEASRSILKEFGVDTFLNDPNELSATTLFGRQPFSSAAGAGNSAALFPGGGAALSQEAVGVGQLLVDSGINGLGQVGLSLQALEDRNLVNILAEPNLTAISGEQAGFLAGGEFPVPAGRDQNGNIVIDFREFGVSLNFKPLVLSGKRISLQMNTEVSSLDFDNAVTLSDLVVPGLDIRRADTTVEVPSGGSLMIAGILRSDALQGMSGLPNARKAPIIGDLIKSESFQRNETELVVIVTPYLVEPYAETDRAERVSESMPRQMNALRLDNQAGKSVPIRSRENPMAKAFSSNIRQSYEVEDEAIFAGDSQYGYMLD